MVCAKVWTTNKRSIGLPKCEDFTCSEETLPPCKDGDIIIEAEVFSVDPYLRFEIRQDPVGSTVAGGQVARVIESLNEEYPVNTYVIGCPGWRTHTHVTRKELSSSNLWTSYKKMPEIGDNPKSTALGVLGMPGNTAYFGFLEVCKPKVGETVVVSSAAGAVGSVVCQIAKIKGCKVIAFAGSNAKVEYLKSLGLKFAFNYKEVDVGKAISEVAPEGVHCYFDNVGGEFTAQVLPQMADYGRIAICGCISTYNDESKGIKIVNMNSPYSEATILFSKLRVEGFFSDDWLDQWDTATQQLREWIEEGNLKYQETITKGFEKLPEAFINLFHGENIGKMIVYP